MTQKAKDESVRTSRYATRMKKLENDKIRIKKKKHVLLDPDAILNLVPDSTP